MNLDELQNKLIQVARANQPSARVPYGFERRVMEALKARPVLDQWALWAQALWQAAAPCVAIVLLLAAWTLLNPVSSAPNPGTATVDVAQDFENTVLAATDQEPPTDLLR